MKDLSEALGMFVLVLGLTLLQWVVAGFVLARVWLWFAVPAFGAPPIGWATAVGMQFLINIARAPADSAAADPKRKRETSEHVTKSVIMILVYYPMALLFAWILHHFA